MTRIGKIQLPENSLFLAPMEDITDKSFRSVCKEHGVDVMISEFISSEGLIRDCEKSYNKMNIDRSERPFGVQLYGHNIDSMVQATKMAESQNPDFIDLNFGCPAKKIAHRGAGAGLLQNIPLMIEMTKAVVQATSLPVTVKTRTGWDEKNINIVDTAKKLQEAGIAAITIHGRTKAQMYKGKANWNIISEVKNDPEIEIPVIGNGDIDSPESAKTAFLNYGVDGVMIGRATVGKPWLFSAIKTYMQTGEIPEEPSITEKVNIARKHLLKSIEWKGHPRGIYEMRRHLSNYFKGLSHFKEIRKKLVTSLDQNELLDTLELIEHRYRNFDSTKLKSDSFFHY
ncbi:MAG: tRNA dihydrouridine synthase DusB [Bacteroidota bacterium]